MKALILKIIDSLRYPSTWVGLLTLAASAGIALKPEMKEAISTAGVAIAGLIMTLFSDADVKPKE